MHDVLESAERDGRALLLLDVDERWHFFPDEKNDDVGQLGAPAGFFAVHFSRFLFVTCSLLVIFFRALFR